MVHAAAAKPLQSCPTLCDPIDGSPPGSPIPRILQARTLEWIAISFSSAWKWKVKVKSLSHVWLFATPWTAAFQAPPSMGFSRQEYWSGVPLSSLIVSRECVIFLVLSHHWKGLKCYSCYSLVLFGKWRIESPRRVRAGRPQRRGLSLSWLPPFICLPPLHLELALCKLG